MSDKRLAGFVASSADPTEVSSRIKGVVLALSSVIIYVAANFLNITLTSNDIIDIATQLGTIGGALLTLYGACLALIRKFAVQK